MNLRRISLLTLLLTFHILLAQQVHSVRTFGLSNGLSSSMTFDIFKDQYGFIWTSTRLGIDCFDDQNFKHYPSDVAPYYHWSDVRRFIVSTPAE